MLILKQAEDEERDSWRDDRMDGWNREQMCRRIPLKKAALQEHVQTEWSEAQGMSAFITHTHTETHTQAEAPLVGLTIPHTISACKDFFIGISHALSFPRKTAVPSYEVIALISGWLRAWTWARSFIIAVWFSPWIQRRHAKTLPPHDNMPQK